MTEDSFTAELKRQAYKLDAGEITLDQFKAWYREERRLCS